MISSPHQVSRDLSSTTIVFPMLDTPQKNSVTIPHRHQISHTHHSPPSTQDRQETVKQEQLLPDSNIFNITSVQNKGPPQHHSSSSNQQLLNSLDRKKTQENVILDYVFLNFVKNKVLIKQVLGKTCHTEFSPYCCSKARFHAASTL